MGYQYGEIWDNGLDFNFVLLDAEQEREEAEDDLFDMEPKEMWESSHC